MERPVATPRRSLIIGSNPQLSEVGVPKPKPRILSVYNCCTTATFSPEFPVPKPRFLSLKRKKSVQAEDFEVSTQESCYVPKPLKKVTLSSATTPAEKLANCVQGSVNPNAYAILQIGDIPFNRQPKPLPSIPKTHGEVNFYETESNSKFKYGYYSNTDTYRQYEKQNKRRKVESNGNNRNDNFGFSPCAIL